MRTNETYLEYFKNLASLENDMIIFTEDKHKDKILSLREGKKTEVITLDLTIFQNYLDRIKSIQNDQNFISRVHKDLLKNIEYFSPYYVLVTNLKSYFVARAIRENDIRTDLVAWVDFGCVRSKETLNNIQRWSYPFSSDKMHFFTIKRKFDFSKIDNIYDCIFNNKVFIAGAYTVGDKKIWQNFYEKVRESQEFLLDNGIVDDDQGVYMMTLFRNPSLIKLHYLGREQWFSIFRKYDETSKVSLLEKIKDIFI